MKMHSGLLISRDLTFSKRCPPSPICPSTTRIYIYTTEKSCFPTPCCILFSDINWFVWVTFRFCRILRYLRMFNSKTVVIRQNTIKIFIYKRKTKMCCPHWFGICHELNTFYPTQYLLLRLQLLQTAMKKYNKKFFWLF